MNNKSTTIQLNKEDFIQLLVYVKQVEEAAATIKTKYKKKIKLDDWLNALTIHRKVLDNYLQHLISSYNIKELPEIFQT